MAATYLNSTLDAAATRSRLAGLHRGEWRLLYVAPERLVLDEWQENLKAWNVAALVIDEAQHLLPPVLEHIRVISNLETNKARLLQIVLIGQPEETAP